MEPLLLVASYDFLALIGSNGGISDSDLGILVEGSQKCEHPDSQREERESFIVTIDSDHELLAPHPQDSNFKVQKIKIRFPLQIQIRSQGKAKRKQLKATAPSQISDVV